MDYFHYLNGQYFSKKELHLNPFDLGLLRGYGVFDYTQIYKGRSFHLKEHLERLEWSAKQIGLPLPKPLSQITNDAKELILKNGPIDGGLRIILTAGECSENSLIPVGNSNLLMLIHPFIPYPDRFYIEGMKVITTKLLRLMPSVKTINYLPAVLAMKQAKNIGFDDAIYLNEKDELLEGTTSNLFFFKKGKLITSNSKDILNGITRKIVLELAGDHFDIEYRSLPLNEIESCDEGFLCSTGKDLVPIAQIDNKRTKKGIDHCSIKLRNLYKSYIENYFLDSSLK